MRSRIRRVDVKSLLAVSIFILGSITLIAGFSGGRIVNVQEQPVAAPAMTRPHIPILGRIGPHQYSPLFLDAAITTDKDDYSPGEIVHISGSGYNPNESVRLQIAYQPVLTFGFMRSVSSDYASGHDPWFVTADESGN